ncbi:ABC transporter ATP-binding protein [Ruminiclostridium herbifermentans]|uniref:ABC transporter ATP-binding protein n=1 Tax=Ruminiclostridium herbifermentans TaxID=2488810 RepID=A0A4U7J830_9FIRM|nr:ABC transporter ATP-binding protein [Ruminiclostridium herbifermentans]QNU66435.1 ABC transporter ATP-binding protein [Ruminiclostridium herbifermentans]
MSLIEIKSLKKSFNDGKENKINVIRGIDLRIEKGEKIAIVGDSGCGKTTFINLIGLILNSDSGEIIINGRNVLELSSKDKANLRNAFFGYVVQDFALVEEDTTYQNLEIPLLYSKKRYSKREKDKLISDTLNKVGLSEKINEKVKFLSGGQRQRVAIARAIINNPSVILADEPTGALDGDTSEKIFSLLNDLVIDGKSLILVTHNEKLANYCDKKYKIETGVFK